MPDQYQMILLLNFYRNKYIKIYFTSNIVWDIVLYKESAARGGLDMKFFQWEFVIK